MKPWMNIAVAAALGALSPCVVCSWVHSAQGRLAQSAENPPEPAVAVAVAAAANESYCTPALKQVLRRVLQSCGLVRSSGGRGCQPVEAKTVATMAGTDFNALFLPMRERAGIVEFDTDSAELDAADRALIDRLFADRRGASNFFVVSRASPEGAVEHNRELSRRRAEAVLTHLKETFRDPELDQQVGLLWMGEEYAQLQTDFCQWTRSGNETSCSPANINRSAFLAWIECAL